MKRFPTLLIGICLTLTVYGQENSLEKSLPQAEKMLPGPPANSTSQYVNDYLQYKWGISVRQQTVGILAHDFIMWTFDNYIRSLSKALPFNLSEQGTPAIYKLLQFCEKYAEQAINTAHETVSRTRPYVVYNETPFVSSMQRTYKTVNSYPADQAVYGWLYSLILAEVCPNHIEKILERGYKYGPAMIISGYSYESDVHAGHMMASALLSRFHANEEFATLLTNAQAEAKKLMGSTSRSMTRADYEAYVSIAGLPASSKYLPESPNENSAQFMCDLNAYLEGKYLRTLDAGKQAIADVEYSADNFCKIYSEVVGIELSASNTPAIYELLCRVHPSGNGATQDAKAYYQRKRPYVYMNESSAYPDDDESLRETGSYPSGHASGSWLMALVLSEVTRSHQDELMRRAYTYGQGRVITGFHWQSDVDAGRMVGSAVYAFLHTESAFVSQMEKAVKEYQKVSGGSSGIRVIEQLKDDEIPVYSISGARIQGTPKRRGIYIQEGLKVVY